MLQFFEFIIKATVCIYFVGKISNEDKYLCLNKKHSLAQCSKCCKWNRQ